MGRLTEQVLSDSHSHRIIDGTLEWIASDYLLSWCEIDTILISQTKQTLTFKVSQKVLKVPFDWCYFSSLMQQYMVSSSLCYFSLIPCLVQSQSDAHTLIPRHCSTLWWHHEWGIPGDQLLMKEMSIYKRRIDVNESF